MFPIVLPVFLSYIYVNWQKKSVRLQKHLLSNSNNMNKNVKRKKHTQTKTFSLQML